MRSSRLVSEPNEESAARIAALHCGQEPASVRRFTTGIGHWVYDVHVPSGERVVVRVGRADQAEDFEGAVHWSGQLRPLGVPLPQLLAQGAWQELPYVVLERLAGDDLGTLYDTLSPQQKAAIAREVERAQAVCRAWVKAMASASLACRAAPCSRAGATSSRRRSREAARASSE